MGTVDTSGLTVLTVSPTNRLTSPAVPGVRYPASCICLSTFYFPFILLIRARHLPTPTTPLPSYLASLRHPFSHNSTLLHPSPKNLHQPTTSLYSPLQLNRYYTSPATILRLFGSCLPRLPKSTTLKTLSISCLCLLAPINPAPTPARTHNRDSHHVCILSLQRPPSAPRPRVAQPPWWPKSQSSPSFCVPTSSTPVPRCPQHEGT
jgi:hypothetical protein